MSHRANPPEFPFMSILRFNEYLLLLRREPVMCLYCGKVTCHHPFECFAPSLEPLSRVEHPPIPDFPPRAPLPTEVEFDGDAQLPMPKLVRANAEREPYCFIPKPRTPRLDYTTTKSNSPL